MAFVTISLQELMGLAHRQLRAADVVTELEAKLSTAKAQHAYIEQELMPAAFREIGIQDLTLEDGRVMKLEPKVSASISEANQHEAFEWLNDHGYAGVIKNLIVTEFGKEEDLLADMVLGFLKEKLLELAVNAASEAERQEMLLKVKQIKSVHPQTLLKVMRECMSAGVIPPEQTFTLWVYDQVKLKTSRK